MIFSAINQPVPRHTEHRRIPLAKRKKGFSCGNGARSQTYFRTDQTYF